MHRQLFRLAPAFALLALVAGCGTEEAAGVAPERGSDSETRTDADETSAEDSAGDSPDDGGGDSADGGEDSGDDLGADTGDGTSDNGDPTDVPGDSSGDAGSDAPDAAVEEVVCRDVDLLFVVDSSASMGDNQRSLVASFPGFIDAMRDRLENSLSFHVGVVTTDDPYQNGENCTEIGDLVTRTRGLESSNRDCGPYGGGTRYIDGLDPALDESFACAAQVGILGSDDERVARALLNAVQPARNAEGACNAGFLRPDSLLVIVILTDEDDVAEDCAGDPFCTPGGSGGGPDDWLAELETYRPEAVENTIVLALIGRGPVSSCGAQISSRLLGFANRFGDRGSVGDICAPSYDAFFAEALPLLDDACKLGAAP